MNILKNLYKSVILFFKALSSKDILIADKNKQEKRYNICSLCEYINRDSYFLFFKKERCGYCGCYIKEKIKFNFEECPDKKW